MKPKKLIPPKDSGKRTKFIMETLRIEISKRIPVLEAERKISEYLDEVWEIYGELENMWSSHSNPDPYVNVPRTVELEIQVDYRGERSVYTFAKS